MPAASTIKPEEREFVVDSGAGMHMVSKRDLKSSELETMSQRRGASKRRGNGKRPWIGLLRDGNASWRIWVQLPFGPVTRNPFSSRKARKSIATHQIMHHSLYLVYPQVPLLHLHLLLQHLHRRKLWQTRKFQQQEEVKRRARTHQQRGMNQQNSKIQIKWRRITEWWVARCAVLATRIQAWIGWWKCSRASRRF